MEVVRPLSRGSSSSKKMNRSDAKLDRPPSRHLSKPSSPVSRPTPIDISTPLLSKKSAISVNARRKQLSRSLKPKQKMSTPQRITFQSQFQLFSKFGDRESDGRHIKLTQSDKWMRQAKVIDGKKITSTDTGICFKKFKTQKLSEDQYNSFIEDLATSKGFDVSELKVKMVNCGPPGFTSTVDVYRRSSGSRVLY